MKVIKRKKIPKPRLYCFGKNFNTGSMARWYIKDENDKDIEKGKQFIENAKNNNKFIKLMSIYYGLIHCIRLGFQNIEIITTTTQLKKWIEKDKFCIRDKLLTNSVKEVQDLLIHFNWTMRILNKETI